MIDINDNNSKKVLKQMLPRILKNMKLNKKRYKDGNYWYGIKLKPLYNITKNIENDKQMSQLLEDKIYERKHLEINSPTIDQRLNRNTQWFPDINKSKSFNLDKIQKIRDSDLKNSKITIGHPMYSIIDMNDILIDNPKQHYKNGKLIQEPIKIEKEEKVEEKVEEIPKDLFSKQMNKLSKSQQKQVKILLNEQLNKSDVLQNDKEISKNIELNDILKIFFKNENINLKNFRTDLPNEYIQKITLLGEQVMKTLSKSQINEIKILLNEQLQNDKEISENIGNNELNDMLKVFLKNENIVSNLKNFRTNLPNEYIQKITLLGEQVMKTLSESQKNEIKSLVNRREENSPEPSFEIIQENFKEDK